MPDVLIDLTPLDTPSRYRGIGRYVADLSHALAQLTADDLGGLSIVGLTTTRPSALVARVDRALDPELGYRGDPALAPTSRDYRRYLVQRRIAMGALARRSGARLLHLPDALGTPLDGSVPRIATCHDLIPLVMPDRYLSGRVGARRLRYHCDRRRYATAERVIAISEATKADVVRELAIDEERVDVVYHGVDHHRFQPIAEGDERALLARELGLERPFLLYLGAFDYRKNVANLLSAYARSGRRAQVDLVLAGPFDERQLHALAAEIDRLRIGRSVHVCGYVPDRLVPALYRQCIGHVFPSRYEGFGLTVLEAMACGAPTITTSVSSLVEVAGDAALIVDPDDVDDLAHAIARVAEDAALRAALRAAGLARAAGFTWRKTALETVAVYRRVLAAPRCRHRGDGSRGPSRLLTAIRS